MKKRRNSTESKCFKDYRVLLILDYQKVPCTQYYIVTHLLEISRNEWSFLFASLLKHTW